MINRRSSASSFFLSSKLNIANTSYKFIESQGFNSLTNESLRIRITEMYERHLKNIITRENRNWDMVYEELMPLMMEPLILDVEKEIERLS